MNLPMGEYTTLQFEMRLRLVIAPLDGDFYIWACLCMDFARYSRRSAGVSPWQLQLFESWSSAPAPLLGDKSSWHPIRKKRGHVVLTTTDRQLYRLGRDK